MLVLHRKASESVEIVVPPSSSPTTILVVVTGLQGQGGQSPDTAKLGFTAPREVVIHRSEVAERIRAEQGASDGSN